MNSIVIPPPSGHVYGLKELGSSEDCSSCKYTLLLPDGHRVCRRYPPIAQPPDSNNGLAFTKNNWWCGEYKKDDQ